MMTYADAKAMLMTLPGIGAKVADCICLMSLEHTQAIPIDTHIYQLTTKYYLPNLKSTKSLSASKYNEIGKHQTLLLFIKPFTNRNTLSSRLLSRKVSGAPRLGTDCAVLHALAQSSLSAPPTSP